MSIFINNILIISNINRGCFGVDFSFDILIFNEFLFVIIYKFNGAKQHCNSSFE